jgi:hypothetical protein
MGILANAMRSRQGSVLVIVLIVILLCVVGIAVVQTLAIENAHRTQTLFVLEDSLQRADGLIERHVSRLKRILSVNSLEPLEKESGSETGKWDGKAYELGWELVKVKASATSWRQWLWVRFTEDKPLRTFRYGIEVRIPAMLAPRSAVLTSVALDTVEPLVKASREEAVIRLAEQTDAEMRAAARAEAFTDMPAAGPAGESPEAFRARLGTGPQPVAVTALEEVLKRLERADDVVFPLDRLRAARSLNRATRPLARRWQDLGRYELAGALLVQADSFGGRRRRAPLDEALALLEAALTPSGACCAEAVVAWRWAYVKMRLAAVTGDAALIATERNDLVRVIQARLGENGFLHRRTDITRREMPSLLEQLWQARVAASVQVAPDKYLLVSVREDGSVPLVHMESPTPMDPLAWTPDGGALIASNMLDVDPANWRRSGGNLWVAWRVSLEGLEPEDIEPVKDDYYPPTTKEYRWVAGSGEMSLNGRTALLHCVKLAPKDEPLYNLMIAWLIDGDKRVGFWIRDESELPGWYSHRATFSPDGARLAVIGRQRRVTGVYVMDVDQVMDAQYRWTCSLDDPDMKVGPLRPRLLVPLPYAELTEDETIGGLSWMAYPSSEWFAFTLVQPSGTQVVFHRTSALAEGAEPVSEFSAPLPYDPEVRPNYATMGRIGTLVQSPPGYLVSAKDALYHLPLPGGATGLPPAWPLGMAGRLSGISDVQTPPWGGVAFFAARDNGGPFGVYALDLTTGQGKRLLGPGGVVSKVREAGRITVSPVPITRTPPVVPVPM